MFPAKMREKGTRVTLVNDSPMTKSIRGYLGEKKCLLIIHHSLLITYHLKILKLGMFGTSLFILITQNTQLYVGPTDMFRYFFVS